MKQRNNTCENPVQKQEDFTSAIKYLSEENRPYSDTPPSVCFLLKSYDFFKLTRIFFIGFLVGYFAAMIAFAFADAYRLVAFGG